MKDLTPEHFTQPSITHKSNQAEGADHTNRPMFFLRLQSYCNFRYTHHQTQGVIGGDYYNDEQSEVFVVIFNNKSGDF